MGQAELYDGLERVWSELKAFTPYAVPFTHRVSRKEVPDYYDIIKHPMDLMTMHKKLKSLEYPSKAAFVADLQQIYDNCFQYNTDPVQKMLFYCLEFTTPTTCHSVEGKVDPLTDRCSQYHDSEARGCHG